MGRLDTERQEKLEPKRMEFAKKQITDLGYEILNESDNVILFYFKDHPVYFYPYTGWHSGKNIKDGRGLAKLLEQIKS